MSLTPVDESTPSSDEDGVAAHEKRPLLARLRVRIRLLWLTVSVTLRQFLRSATDPENDTTALPSESGRVSRSRTWSSGARMDRSDAATADVTVDTLPVRTQSPSNASEAGPRNRVDLEAELTDETLTISVPGEPEATLTSDVWEQVEQ